MNKSSCAFLALFICLPVLSWGQQSPAPATAAGQAEAVSPVAPQNAEGRIHLDVVVTDKAGKPITGLAASDFTLLDNNQPSKILSFHAINGSVQEAEPPVEVLLLIDAVNNDRTQVTFVRQQVEKFLLQNDGKLAQPVSLFILSYAGVSAQPQPSTDGKALAAGLHPIEIQFRASDQATGGEGSLERFKLSERMFEAIINNEAKKPGRKLLIWLGAGWPMLDSRNSGTTAEIQQQRFNGIIAISTALRESRTSVYSVSSGDPDPNTFLYEDYLKGVKTADKANFSHLALKVFAVESGGLARSPSGNLLGEINRCVQDASAYYTLSFDPPQTGRANEYHDLKVQVNKLDKLNKPKVIARTSTGYYSQP
jgi:VWFA-related protein